MFVDSDFVRASPAGGDFAGQTAEDALRAQEILEGQRSVDPGDHALAQQLQAEEEINARRQHEAYIREQRAKRDAKARVANGQPLEKALKEKKKDCIIM